MITTHTKQSQNQIVLPDYYYLHNFKTLVSFVYQHHRKLLSEAEGQFFRQFVKLPENCQCLYIRLLSRTGEFIRESKLLYAEIEDISGALDHLANEGYIADAPINRIEEWASLFSSRELQSTLGVPGLEPGFATVLLSTTDLFGRCPVDTLLESDRIVQIHHQHLFTTFQLLFFGNLHHDLSTFVLRDLGVRRFENYLTDTTKLPWQTREQVDAHLQYYQCVELYDEAQAEGTLSLIKLHGRLPQILGYDKNLIRKVTKLANRIARQLEREGALVEAAQIYRSNTQPPARERLARIESKSGSKSEAYRICQQILQDPLTAEEQTFAEDFSAQLAKKLDLTHQKNLKIKPPEITLQLTPSNLSVEHAAALHFAKTGKCYYVENTLITGIFGLAIWDIIFAPIPGVFYHPFQSAPTDFHDADFYTQRKNLFDRRLDEIRRGDIKQIVLTNFHTKYGIRNPLINWGALNRYLITHAMNNIPTQHWLIFFDYLLQDIRNHRSGLPDLIYFPDDADYTLLEVKGPGDRVQKNQLRWMQHFSKNQINHAVVLVEYTEPRPAMTIKHHDLLAE